MSPYLQEGVRRSILGGEDLTEMSDTHDPGPDLTGAGPVEYRPTEAVPAGALAALHARHEARLMAIPGVTFVGVGKGGLLIGVLDESVAARLPRDLEGVSVTLTVTGPVDALPSPRDNPVPR